MQRADPSAARTVRSGEVARATDCWRVPPDAPRVALGSVGLAPVVPNGLTQAIPTAATKDVRMSPPLPNCDTGRSSQDNRGPTTLSGLLPGMRLENA
jgi:hypothetical protein